MKSVRLIHAIFQAGFGALFMLLFASAPLFAQSSDRVELSSRQSQFFEVDLSRYVTSDVKTRKTFEISATVAEPIKAENGMVIIPAQTKVRLKAAVTPGKSLGHPGEIVMWIDPFLIGKGTEGFACDPAAAASTPPLLPLLCEKTWRISFDHQVDHAATPEMSNPKVFVRKPTHEGLQGTKHSKPSNYTFDQSGANVDIRLQTATNRYQIAGAVYEIGAAVVSGVRYVFSKRNLFLPSGTRVVFQLQGALRLVPADDAPADNPLATESFKEGDEEKQKEKKKKKKRDAES